MNYANLKYNDIANGRGISVSLFVSGCPHHCPGCFNSETWDEDYGTKFTAETLNEIIAAIAKNGITRRLSILGGEPLWDRNYPTVLSIVKEVKKAYPENAIYLWTGYTKEEKEKEFAELGAAGVNIIVDGRFDESQKAYLFMRGSTNQRIWSYKNGEFIDVTDLF